MKLYHLRQYIRQTILESPELQSDMENFVHNRNNPPYSSSRSMSTQHREYAKTTGRGELTHGEQMSDDEIDRSFELRRDVKRFWNENADHKFWQNPNKVIAVHDLGYYSDLGDPDEDDPSAGLWQAEDEDDMHEKDLSVPLFMKKYPPGKIQKDEMSTYGFLGSLNSIFPLKKINLGIVLEPRRVTYASKRDAFSESRGQASQADKARHKGSGLPKRPRVGSRFLGRNQLFDEADVKAAGKIGELIVDNWTYKIVVLNPAFYGNQAAKAVISSIKAHGVDVYHSKTGKKL